MVMVTPRYDWVRRVPVRARLVGGVAGQGVCLTSCWSSLRGYQWDRVCSPGSQTPAGP